MMMADRSNGQYTVAFELILEVRHTPISVAVLPVAARPPLPSAVVLMIRVVVVVVMVVSVMAVLPADTGSAAVSSAGADTAVA